MKKLFRVENLVEYKNFSGIYYIKVDKYEYVGSSVNLYERLKDHVYDLRKNRHHNPFMQRLYNKYEESKFKFSIIEYCSVSKLITREIFYYNNLNFPINNRHPVKLVRPEDFGERISKGARGRIPVNRKKVYQYDLAGNFIQEFESATKAAKILGLEWSAICCNCRGTGCYTVGNYRFSYEKIRKLEKLFKVYNSVPIYQYSLNNIFIKEWRSITEAKNELNISNITRAVKYNLTAGGFKWKKVKI